MKRLGIMTDIETLGTGPRTIITQWAFIAFDLDDPETIVKEVHEYLPIQPQIVFSRTWTAKTLIWWMQQSDEARAGFANNDGNDLEELLAVLRSVTRKFDQTIAEASEYEVWARGPQFDLVAIESLLEDIGEPAPWSYQAVMDLRTTMKLAKLKTADVTKQVGLVDHNALDDCRFQIACYSEAMRQMHSSTGAKTHLADA